MKDTILTLLSEKFPSIAPERLEGVAQSLSDQHPDMHQVQALVSKLTLEQLSSFLTPTPVATEIPSKEQPSLTENSEVPTVAPFPVSSQNTASLTRLVEQSVLKAITAFEQRLSHFERQQSEQQRLQQLQQVLSSCQDDTFRQQSLKDFSRMHFASPEDFSQYLSGKQSDVLSANQALSNRSLAQNHTPLFAREPKSGISPSVTLFIEQQQAENPPLRGKKL